MLSRLVITFLPRSKHLLISWLQSPSVVILEPPKINSFHCFPIYFPWSDGTRCQGLSITFTLQKCELEPSHTQTRTSSYHIIKSFCPTIPSLFLYCAFRERKKTYMRELAGWESWHLCSSILAMWWGTHEQGDQVTQYAATSSTIQGNLLAWYPGKPLCPRQTRVAGDPTQDTQYKKL